MRPFNRHQVLPQQQNLSSSIVNSNNFTGRKMLSNTFTSAGNNAGDSSTRKTTAKTRNTIDNSEISVPKGAEGSVAKQLRDRSALVLVPVCKRGESVQGCANVALNTNKAPVRKEYFRFVKSSEYSDTPVNSTSLGLRRDVPDEDTQITSSSCTSSSKQRNRFSSASEPERISSPQSISSSNHYSHSVKNSPELHSSNENRDCGLSLPRYKENFLDDKNLAKTSTSQRISPIAGTNKRNARVKSQEALKKRRIQTRSYDASVRRSKRNISVTVCYNEEKVTATNSQLNKRLNESISSPSSLNKRIRIGSSYQVEFLPAYLKDNCKNEQKVDCASSNYADQDEPLWLSNDRISNQQLEEFCAVARRHQNLGADDALNVLLLHGHSICDALIWLEKYQPKRPTIDWMEEEKKVFEKMVSRTSKPFSRVAKALPNKTIFDVVEYYYKVKKTRCFTPPFEICPFRSKVLTPDPVPVRRSECLNCLQSLYKNTRHEGRGRRRKVSLCLACELYMKLTKSHRPFGVKLVKNEENTSPPPNSQGSNNSNAENLNNQCKDIEINEKSVAEKHCHEFCYFKPRIEQLNRREKWNDDEILLCLKAMKKYGAKWELVAAELPGRNVYDIAEFYSEYQFIYRLDFLINLSGKCDNDSSTTAGHPTSNGGGASVANGRARRNRNNSGGLNNNTILPDDEKILTTRQRSRRGASHGNTGDDNNSNKSTDSETDAEKKEDVVTSAAAKEEKHSTPRVGATTAAARLSLVAGRNVARRYVYRTRTRQRQQQY